MNDLKKFTLVCGHYGCGKTNLSINLAINKAKQGKKVTLVDLDLVNPYFRSSDYAELLKEQGVRVLSPLFAGTNLDIPSLPPEIYSVFDTDSDVILDVGGDDAGATVLGRLAEKIQQIDYDFLYVVNKYRILTTKAEEAAALLKEIERSSRLKGTAVVNNSHIKQLTTPQDVMGSVAFAQSAADLLGLPLLFTTVPEHLAKKVDIENVYPVQIYVRSPWETESD